MKIAGWMLGILMVIAIVVFGLQVIASETGEVVVLYTAEHGEESATRLWVVEHGGNLWLRSGGGGESGWLQRVSAEPQVALERDGVRRSYTATLEPDMAARINQLMQTKYGWRDDVVALLAGSRDDAVAIRLVPAG